MGRKLKAIFITHPDVDHYLGLAVLHRRFPAAAIYMAPRALDVFEHDDEPAELAGMKKFKPTETPEEEPTPASYRNQS